jgi:hypothetical protein
MLLQCQVRSINSCIDDLMTPAVSGDIDLKYIICKYGPNKRPRQGLLGAADACQI